MLESARARISDAIVSVFSYERYCESSACPDDCMDHLRIHRASSGVLIKLADVEFVLTSAHGIWNHEARDFRPMIDVAGPERRQPTPITVGRSVLRAFVSDILDGEGYPDPDVALLEITQHAVLPAARRPYGENEISSLPPAGPRRIVIFAGFPGTHSDLAYEEALDAERFDTTPVVYASCSLEHGADAHDPRIAQVLLETELAAIDGVSGGPLVLPEGEGILVGLARQVIERGPGESSVHFEPAHAALRVLCHPQAILTHRNPDLVGAVERVLDRAFAARLPA